MPSFTGKYKDISYLGDGVYCGHDGYQIWLYTQTGGYDDQAIALDPYVQERLRNYVHFCDKSIIEDMGTEPNNIGPINENEAQF